MKSCVSSRDVNFFNDYVDRVLIFDLLKNTINFIF